MALQLEVTNENFAAVAIAAGYVPRAQVEKLLKDRDALLVSRGVVLPWAPEGQSPADQAQPVAPLPPPPPPVQEIIEPPKKRPGRPAKAADADPMPASDEVGKQVDIEEAIIDAKIEAVLTHEAVRNILRELAAAVDVAASRELLTEFSVNKASEVPAEKIKEFVAAGRAKIAAHPKDDQS